MESENFAWQNFHKTQIEGLKKKIERYVSTEENQWSDRTIEEMIDELLRDREPMEKAAVTFETIKEEEVPLSK